MNRDSRNNASSRRLSSQSLNCSQVRYTDSESGNAPPGPQLDQFPQLSLPQSRPFFRPFFPTYQSTSSLENSLNSSMSTPFPPPPSPSFVQSAHSSHLDSHGPRHTSQCRHQPSCRMCGLSAGPLIIPCQCGRPEGLLHKHCLRTWVRTSGWRRCNQCGHRFRSGLLPSRPFRCCSPKFIAILIVTLLVWSSFVCIAVIGLSRNWWPKIDVGYVVSLLLVIGFVMGVLLVVCVNFVRTPIDVGDWDDTTSQILPYKFSDSG